MPEYRKIQKIDVIIISTLNWLLNIIPLSEKVGLFWKNQKIQKLQ